MVDDAGLRVGLDSRTAAALDRRIAIQLRRCTTSSNQVLELGVGGLQAGQCGVDTSLEPPLQPPTSQECCNKLAANHQFDSNLADTFPCLPFHLLEP